VSVLTFVPRGLAVLAMSLALAACSGGGATAGASQPAGGGGASSTQPSDGSAVTTPAGSAGGPVTGHVGDKLTFKNFANDPVDATLIKVYDPATPDDASESPLPPATHWVGVEVIVNDQIDYQSDAADFDAVTSAGSTVSTTNGYMAASALGDGFKGCTHTDGSGGDVNPYTYCAAFAVPDGQTLVKVGLNVTGPPLVKTDQATWMVP